MGKEKMRTYSAGLISLSGCFGGELSRALQNAKDGNEEEARKVIEEHISIFGKENYFIEVMNHVKMEGALEVRNKLVSLAKEYGLDIVGTQDSHYLHPDDHNAHDTM